MNCPIIPPYVLIDKLINNINGSSYLIEKVFHDFANNLIHALIYNLNYDLTNSVHLKLELANLSVTWK